MFFIDGNWPGVVYSGTAAHMEGCSREGGSPFVWEGEPPIDDDGDPWTVRQAPGFWAEP